MLYHLMASFMYYITYCLVYCTIPLTASISVLYHLLPLFLFYTTYCFYFCTIPLTALISVLHPILSLFMYYTTYRFHFCTIPLTAFISVLYHLLAKRISVYTNYCSHFCTIPLQKYQHNASYAGLTQLTYWLAWLAGFGRYCMCHLFPRTTFTSDATLINKQQSHCSDTPFLIQQMHCC